MNKKRARSAEEKEARKNTILVAAWELYEQSDGKLPTVLSIAQKTGLSKGAIYLYFKNKEEIFLSQCVFKLTEWFAAIQQSIENEQVHTAKEVATRYVQHVIENPLVLKITSIIKSVLEENIDDEFVYQAKLKIAALLTTSGNMVAGLIPGISEREGTKFILRAYSLISGLWQIADVSPAIFKRLKDNGIEAFQPEFEENAIEAVELLFKGSFEISN